jgi:hypothetical protein
MRVCFVVASGQATSYGELFEAFGAALRDDGIETQEAVDHFPAAEADLVYVFAPHEYLPRVRPESFPEPEHLGRTVVLSVEQPGTHAFEHVVDVALRAAGTVALDAGAARALRERGVRATHVPFGYVPAWDHWHGSEHPRATDLVFVGTYTQRRGQALARLGAVTQDRSVDLRIVDPVLPPASGDPSLVSGAAKWRLLADARMMFQIPASPLGSLDWPEAVAAMSNGCVVLTEHAASTAPLRSGEHLFSARFEHLHLSAAALLDDPDRLRCTRDAAYRMLRDELPLSDSVPALVGVLEVAAGGPVGPRRPGAPTPRPRPHTPEPRLPDHLVADGSELDPIRMGLKKLVVESTSLRREVRVLAASGHGGEEVVELFGAYEAARPEVSVVVTVYDYAEYVGAALASAARSRGVPFEIVVVDDASNDDSVPRIREALGAASWVPSALIRLPVNQGLAAARNRGLRESRGRLVQILDADNELYPGALRRLRDALDGRPDAAFAYGAIEMFDFWGPKDLFSWRHWDPARLSYGNYVDAMAVVRRDAVMEVGGYTADAALHGWEDFALWCALVDAGHAGVSVPQIVARYRVGLTSMLSTSGIDTSAAWATLIRRYPWLLPAATG